MKTREAKQKYISAKKPQKAHEPLIEIKDLHVYFPIKSGVFKKTTGFVKAVDGVSLHLQAGEIASVVGESGCGKSTLGNALLGLVRPTSGSIRLSGHEIDYKSKKAFLPFRRDFQFIFQDPYSSLNPRHTIYEILSEPLLVHNICPKRQLKDEVANLLKKVGLEPDYMERYPHSFSGGQRQRISIARAIGLRPKAIICDEIVASLDVSVQAQIINLLLELKEELGLALLFISHDLSLVRFLSDRIYVMYLGNFMEKGPVDAVFSRPSHPYTKALLDAIPTLDLGKRPLLLKGEVPSPANKPSGCAFRTRCLYASGECGEAMPQMQNVSSKTDALSGKVPHQAACFHPLADSL